MKTNEPKSAKSGDQAASPTLMRCTVTHWQGDVLIPAGTLRPVGHREVIPQFFEKISVEDVIVLTKG